jgi:hypothetical protein
LPYVSREEKQHGIRRQLEAVYFRIPERYPRGVPRAKGVAIALPARREHELGATSVVEIAGTVHARPALDLS